MIIRKLTLETVSGHDFRAMVEMEENCGLIPYSPEMLWECIASLDTYGCFDSNTLTGFVTVQPGGAYLPDSIYIVNLNVSQPYRRRGIGENLLAHSCSQYPDAAFVTLDTGSGNTAARGLYAKLSFRETQIPSRNGPEDLVMIAEISELLSGARRRRIRRAEKLSHMQAYQTYRLYDSGSWLAKPVKTVLECIKRMEGREGLRVLDLGCGVGRNSIASVQLLAATADCVDILPYAILRLKEYADAHAVSQKIRGIISAIDEFSIPENSYDLILAISALEHMDSESSFRQKLMEIRRGLRNEGIACLIVNSGVQEEDSTSRERLEPQFEVNLPTEEMLALLRSSFSGMEVLKETVVQQEYDIPRGDWISHVTTSVVTLVVRR